MSSEESENTVLETIVPQDKTSGVNRVMFGYSIGEILLVILPTFLYFYTMTSILGFSLNQWVVVTTGAIGFGLFMVIKLTPWYNTPLEILSRSVAYARSRLRMPLVADEATEVPGVVDIHSEYEAVELPDGSLAAAVEVPLINTSQLDRDQYLAQVSQLATSLNSTIGRDGGTGFDVKIRLSQTIPSAGAQVEGLREAGRNGYPVEDGGTPHHARRYAEEQAENTIDQLERNSVMERRAYIITSVHPSKTNDSGNIIDRFSSLSIVRPSGQQYDSQAALLDNRIQTVKNAVQVFSTPVRLTTDELVDLYREHWLDSDGELSYSDVDTDGTLANQRVSVTTEPYESEGRTTSEAAELTEAGEETPKESGGETAEADETDENEGGVAGRISAAREKFTSITESLRGHTSESSRKKLIHSPAFVDEHSKCVEVDDHYLSTIWVTGWPKHPDAGLLEDILTIPEVRYDIAISLEATDYHKKLDSLATTRQRITNSAVMKEQSGDGASGDATSLAADVQVLREQMQDYDLECFEVSMAITVRAESKSAVEDARRRIASRCSAVNISTTTASNRQLAALRATSPSPKDHLREETRVDTAFDMTSDGVACLFPFGGYHIVEPDGTLYGMAKTGARSSGDSLGMLQMDRLRRTAPHRFWVGRSGSGKSFDIKNHIIEEMDRNPTEHTVIVDIARGFDGPTKAFDGSKIVVGETTINPFEIRPPEDTRGTRESLDDKVRLITDMFQIYMMHNAPEEEAQAIRSSISKTVRQTYKDVGGEDDDVGITNDPTTHSKPSPTVEDYFDTLAEMSENTSEYTYKNTQTEIDALKDDIGVLLNRLKEFQPGGTYDYLCGESDVDMYDRVVYFDMNKFENDSSAAKGMIMALITSHAYELAKQTSGHVNLVVDEAHDLFRDAAQADQIESMVRAGRNTGLMFDFISQAGEDFDAGAAKVIAKQCSIAIWRDLGEMDVETPLEFGLTHEQAQLVSGELATGDNEAMDYSEALVDVEGDRYLIERRVSDYAARIVDYRESEHGEFDAYMEGKSLKQQRAEAGRAKAESLYANYNLIEEILTTVWDAREQDSTWREIEGQFAEEADDRVAAAQAVSEVRAGEGTVIVEIDGRETELDPDASIKENAERLEREAEQIEKELDSSESSAGSKRQSDDHREERQQVEKRPDVLGAALASADNEADEQDKHDDDSDGDGDGAESAESAESGPQDADDMEDGHEDSDGDESGESDDSTDEEGESGDGEAAEEKQGEEGEKEEPPLTDGGEGETETEAETETETENADDGTTKAEGDD